jgi:hypothetical protein
VFPTHALAKLRVERWHVAFCSALFVFSFWIMFRTFSYDSESSSILVSNLLWSDFAATLPLIRSFSMGENWPPEYPIFPGSPIRYHYLFFFLVGKLEALGVPLHWALNVPSALGFFLLLAMIYLLGRKWFDDARVGVLGVVFFLFNGSMGFVQFFQKFPPSLATLSALLSHDQFSAMGPWDGGQVLGVWHLLVFVNQRHFSVALGILLGFIYVCHRLEGARRGSQLGWALLCGTLIGFFPIFHKPVLLMFAVVMSAYFMLLPRSRPFLLATGAVSVLVMGLLSVLPFNAFAAPGGFGWYPGFMIHDSLGLIHTLKFFWYQFGLHALLIPLGCCLAPRRLRGLLIPPFIVLGIGFLFRFSEKEVLVGHKFFNFFLLIGQLFTAYAIVRAYDFASENLPRWRVAALAAAAGGVSLLTLSGVIDFLPIANRHTVAIRDIRANPAARWFAENTPKDALVLTSEYFYPAPSIAGRKVFMGYAYFTDSAGYDTEGRLEIVESIYRAESLEGMCSLLRSNRIDYVDVEEHGADQGRPPVNLQYFRENFSADYVSADGRYAVYSTARMCGLALGWRAQRW